MQLAQEAIMVDGEFEAMLSALAGLLPAQLVAPEAAVRGRLLRFPHLSPSQERAGGGRHGGWGLTNRHCI